MKILLLAFLIVNLSSCASSRQQAVNHFALPVNIDAANTFNKNEIQYLSTNCVLYDLKSTKSYNFRGNLCSFTEEGKLLHFSGITLIELDAARNSRFIATGLNLRETLSVSRDQSEILTVESELWKDENHNCYSSDKLLVLNQNGKITKSFSVTGFLTHLPLFKAVSNLSPATQKDCQPSSKIITQMRDFSEFYYGESAIQKGYMAFDKNNRRLFIFDNNLKVVKLHTETDRVLRSPVQSEKNKLIFYEAYKKESSSTYLSRLVRYDVNSETYEEIYSSTLELASEYDCGSVSLLNPGMILIVHSHCISAPQSNIFFTEKIDFENKTSEILKVNALFTPSTATPVYHAEGLLKLLLPP